MILITLVAALAALYAFPPPERQALAALLGRLCLSTAKRLDAGDRNSGLLAYGALVAVVLVPLAIVTWVAAALHGIVLAALDAAVLYASLRFLQTTAAIGAIERVLRDGDGAGASRRLAQWTGETQPSDDLRLTASRATEHGLRESHHGTFALLFWYIVLPGPLGVVLYALTQRAATLWGTEAGAGTQDFGWFAGRAFHYLDWVPQRMTAFAFATVGNFEDALLCWRSQAAQWPHPDEGIVIASGAGALGVRLGEAPAAGDDGVERPFLGTGEPAGEDALAALEGMLWRTIVLWLVVFLLLAALRLG